MGCGAAVITCQPLYTPHCGCVLLCVRWLHPKTLVTHSSMAEIITVMIAHTYKTRFSPQERTVNGPREVVPTYLHRICLECFDIYV
jgi:hypothetical protein